jgi:hypothetical protein
MLVLAALAVVAVLVLDVRDLLNRPRGIADGRHV